MSDDATTDAVYDIAAQAHLWRERAERAEDEAARWQAECDALSAARERLHDKLDAADAETARCSEGWTAQREATNRAEYKLGQAIDLLRAVRSCESCLDDLPESWFTRADALFKSVFGEA